MSTPVRQCPDCYLKYEEPPHFAGLRCPWCGPPHVGTGLSFDAACRHALKKIRETGERDGVRSIVEHTVHFVETGSDGVVHMVKLSRDRV